MVNLSVQHRREKPVETLQRVRPLSRYFLQGRERTRRPSIGLLRRRIALESADLSRKMAETGQTEFEAQEFSKESPPPQEAPGSSTTPETDAEGKLKKARTTIILREVDTTATEEKILALFDDETFKVVSIRMDVQNTWFVNMENEDMAKQAVLQLSQKTLCDKPVKARLKSEGTLRTAAPPWQPTAQVAQAIFMQGYGAQGYQQQAPPGSQGYGTWGSGKPASINRPPSGGVYKRQSPVEDGAGEGEMNGQPGSADLSQIQAGGEHAHHHGGRAGTSGSRRGPNSGQSRQQGDKRGGRRNQNQQATVPQKPVVFQPGDFPSLTGSSVAAVEATSTQVFTPAPPIPEAPANSWAARAKTAADTTVVAPTKKETAAVMADNKPTTKKESAPVAQSEKKAAVDAPIAREFQKPVRENPATATSPAQPSSAQTAEEVAAEVKRRGWEKPGLAPSKKETAEAETQKNAPAGADDVKAKEPSVKEQSVEKTKEGKKSSGKRSEKKDKNEMNGHAAVNPVIPLAWASKSFAQIIKEAPVSTGPASQSNLSPSGGSAIPALRGNENWGDVEDDEPVAANGEKQTNDKNGRSGGSSRGGLVQLEKLKTSSEGSNDWRRDAAARRISEEQTRGPASDGSRKPKASS